MTMQMMILQWYFKLGHAGLGLVMWLEKNGYQTRGTHMAHAKGKTIKCRTCNLVGKQPKMANPLKHVENKNLGELRKDVLQPGQLVFSDQ